MILTYTNIEEMAEIILKDFMGALTDNSRTICPIDIEAFATRYLGLRIGYTKLSDTGEVLGLTTYADVDVELDRYMRKQAVKVARNSILIDESLIKPFSQPDKQKGRRRFTISHECSHQIFYRNEPDERQQSLKRQYSERKTYSLRELKTKDDWSEWQANALGAALLMPPKYISLLIQRHAKGRRLVSYENRFIYPDKLALNLICNALGVSRAALVIRLRQLGYIEDKPCSSFHDPLEVCCD